MAEIHLVHFIILLCDSSSLFQLNLNVCQLHTWISYKRIYIRICINCTFGKSIFRVKRYISIVTLLIKTQYGIFQTFYIYARMFLKLGFTFLYTNIKISDYARIQFSPKLVRNVSGIVVIEACQLVRWVIILSLCASSVPTICPRVFRASSDQISLVEI